MSTVADNRKECFTLEQIDSVKKRLQTLVDLFNQKSIDLSVINIEEFANFLKETEVSPTMSFTVKELDLEELKDFCGVDENENPHHQAVITFTGYVYPCHEDRTEINENPVLMLYFKFSDSERFGFPAIMVDDSSDDVVWNFSSQIAGKAEGYYFLTEFEETLDKLITFEEKVKSLKSV